MVSRGQVTLIALAALSLAVIVVTYFILSGRTTESEIKVDEVELRDLVSEFEKERRSLENMLLDATNGALSELVAHAGYTLESLPDINRGGIPLYFYRGNVVNLPTLHYMNAMLAQDVERRLNSRLDRHREELRVREDRFTIGYPTIVTNVSDDFVMVRMSIPVSVEREGEAVRSEVTFEKVVPSRMGHFRGLAEAFVLEYEKLRAMEGTLIGGIIQDDRIWEPPGRLMHSTSCEDPDHRSLEEMTPAIHENVEVAVALELVRVRAAYGEEHVLWEFKVDVSQVNTTLLANVGNLDWQGRDWSTDSYPAEIYLIPQKVNPMSAMNDVCFSSYTASYDITFLVLVTITDLTPTSREVGGDYQELIRIPKYSFYVQPFLGHLEDGRPNKFAVDRAISQPEFRDNPCEGSCSIGLELEGTKKGKIWIDDCPYTYTTSESAEESEALDFVQEGISCGLRTLVIESDDPVKARLVDRVNVVTGLKKSYTIKDFATVTGTVYKHVVTLCRRSDRMKEEELPMTDAGDGMIVNLLPSEPRLGGVLTTTLGDDGTYRFENVNPGQYIVLARPAMDQYGTLAYALEPEATIKQFDEGETEGVDLALRPLDVAKVGTTWSRVTSVENEC